MTERGDARERTFTAWLIAYGRRPWTGIRPLLSGCTCAWADLDGFHAEAPPQAAPLTTHLWAWGASRLLRVRLDGSEGIAAELCLAAPGHGEPVEVLERETVSWPSGEGRVSAGQAWRDQVLRVYQVVGLMPLEFTRLEDAGR